MVKRIISRLTIKKAVTLLLVTFIEVVFFYIMNSSYLSMSNIRGIMYSMILSGTITCGMACLMIGSS